MPRRSTDAPIYRRGDSPYWWTWVYECGRRRRVSTKCTDRRAALATAAAIQRESASPQQRHQHETVADALVAYLDAPVERAIGTIIAYHQRAANLSESIGRVRIADLSREDVELYVKARGVGPRTLRNELLLLRSALRLAKQRGRPVPDLDLLAVPVPGRVEPRTRWLTRDEVDQLLEALPVYWAEWVRLAVYTGARLQEVNALQWSDVDWRARTIHIRGEKTDGSDRIIPIAPVLSTWMRTRHRRSGPIVRPLKTPNGCLRPVARRLGIPDFSPHDLRRTFASWLKQAGVDSLAVARLLGHTGTRLVDSVYGHLDLSTLEVAVGKL